VGIGTESGPQESNFFQGFELELCFKIILYRCYYGMNFCS
jgi:hypothetical protein